MKKVLKGQEPSLLKSYRTSTPGNTWEAFSKKTGRKTQVQQQLKADQNGLCAYCEIDLLDADEDGNGVADFRVEHFHPKSATVAGSHNWHLDWHNLLGCCHGGSKNDVIARSTRYTSPDHSCDVPKANQNMTGVILNPLTDVPAFPEVFKCDRATGILSVNTNNCNKAGISPVQAQQTIDELRLNADRLKRFRKTVLDRLNYQLQEQVKRGIAVPQAMDQLTQAYLCKNNQQQWPAFFTSIRDYLGPAAEKQLQAIGYQG